MMNATKARKQTLDNLATIKEENDNRTRRWLLDHALPHIEIAIKQGEFSTYIFDSFMKDYGTTKERVVIALVELGYTISTNGGVIDIEW